MGKVKRWLMMLWTVAPVVLLLAVVVYGSIYWVGKDEPEPIISHPSIVTFSHPTGSLTCGYTDASISCVPTQWLVPSWSTVEEAKALYNIRAATNGQ